MNSLTRIKAGETFVVREGAYNAFCDAAEANVKRLGGMPTGGKISGDGTVTVRVKNNTGENLNEFETFCADHNMTGQAGQLTIDGNEYGVASSPTVCIGQVDKEEGSPHLLILQEPISDGEHGQAVIRGLCIAKLDILSLTHTYADLPVTGSVLKSGAGGRVRILQHESASVGEQYCLVDLLQSPVGDVIIRVNAGGPTNGLYSGNYARRSTTSPYSYEAFGAEIRVIAIGGGTFETTTTYHIGKVVGTVTISDVVYDLVDTVGDANYTTLNGSSQETAWAGGLISTTAQSFKGEKTFRNQIFVKNPLDSAAYIQLAFGAAVFSSSSAGVTINSGTITIARDVAVSVPMQAIFSLENDATYPCLFIDAESPGSPGYGGVATNNRFGVGLAGAINWGGTATIDIDVKNHADANVRHTFFFNGGLFTGYFYDATP